MTALVRVEHLRVIFDGARPVVAVDNVSFALDRGEILALVGESGSGKSTIARAIAGLVPPVAGRILLDGEPIVTVPRRDRRRIQMVFQDPDSSLNPFHSVGWSLAEPLRVRGIRDPAAVARRTAELLALVGLDPALLDRRPRALSGGQKQRIAIARALAMEPDLLIADEALSALDVRTQAAVGGLLRELGARLGLAILFISHDLLMVRHLAHRIVILRQGRIVEEGPCLAVLEAPAADYTRLLIASTPDLDCGLDLDDVPPAAEGVSP